jgi:hypothetical protein
MVIGTTNVVIDTGDPDFIIVAFESEKGGSRRYLMLQRAHEFGEEDVALGMDGVYIERDDQRYSAYGGITRLELHRDHALITLDSVTARKLGDDPEIEVRFDLEHRQFTELRAGLAEIFRGFGCFTDLAT